MSVNWIEALGPSISAAIPEDMLLGEGCLEFLSTWLAGQLLRQGWSENEIRFGAQRRNDDKISDLIERLHDQMSDAVHSGSIELGEVANTHRSMGLALGLALKDISLDRELACITGSLKLLQAVRHACQHVPLDQIVAELRRLNPRTAFHRAYDPSAPHNRN